MALTDTVVKNAKSSTKSYKLFDGGGLYLEVTPQGRKRWRVKYRYLGKEKLLSAGIYPEVPLRLARQRRDEMKKLLAEGVDPSANRKVAKNTALNVAANSFELVAREWLAKQAKTWTDVHFNNVLRRLECNVFPWLGSRPIAQITPIEVLSCVQRIENRGALETAHRALQNCGQIFRYAVATARIDRDPTADLKGALPPVQSKHLAAITDPQKVGHLLRALDCFQGTFVVQCALKLAPLVFVRPGELRRARWADVDLEGKEWCFHVTKTKSEHIVPLSSQALAILRELQPLTGSSEYVFPSGRGFARPMSEGAVLAALRRMGIGKDEMSGHGFRAMARTILDEVLEFPAHIIEHQLAHAVRDPNGRAYNRTAHLPQRHKMMQTWADYLDDLKSERVVILMKRGC